MAGFFPVFFKEYWSNTDSVTLSTWYLGLANSIASIVVAVFAPFLGAIADRGTAKKKFLITFAFIGILGTGALWMVKQGDWQLAVILYIIGSIGYAAGNIFYDSLLPGVASKKKSIMLLHWAFPLGISEAVYFFCSMFSCTNILKCLEYPTLQSPLEYPLCLWQCGGPYFQFQLSFL
jgi:UMF1 family MFS transporter